jgi:RNA polymerase sigma-70 factor (ECF subfamily)
VFEALPSDPEQHLMLRFQAGDELAFEQLYQRVRDPVWRYARRMLGEDQAAEEAAQEILVRIFRARRSYQPTARFHTWLYRVATNHCLNERQRAWRRREVDLPEGEADSLPASSPDPAQGAEAAALAHAVQAALDALPARQRAAVVLARWEGCSMEEIAQALDLPSTGAAKLLLHRARSALEQHLSPYLAPAAEEVP